MRGEHRDPDLAVRDDDAARIEDAHRRHR